VEAGDPELNQEATLRLAISSGDPAGIGPEVIAKALAAPDLFELGADPSDLGGASRLEFLLVGDPRVFAAAGLGPGGAVSLLPAGEYDPDREPLGAASARSGRAAVAALEAATDEVLSGRADALVTAPLSKHAMAEAGFAWPGQTELIAERSGAAPALDPVMLFVAGRLKVALFTRHVPLRDVASRLAAAPLVACLRTLEAGLRQDFAIQSPRIAVAGLNPHAGEQGLFGSEEEQSVIPAVHAARDQGLLVEGPLPADTLFCKLRDGAFDAVLALYHDQGLIPVKLLSFGRATNVSLGLPLVRTSPDHGTAYDIAGKGIADASSMRAAILTAVEMVRNRRSFLNRGG